MMFRSRDIQLYLLAWPIIILLSLSAGFFNSVLLDLPFHLRQELPFSSRWMIWMILTPFAVRLSKKVNYADNAFSRFLLYHLSIYILLCTVHILLSSALASCINLLLNGTSDYQVILIKCTLTGIFYNFIVYAIIVLLENVLAYYNALQRERIKILDLEKLLVDTRLQFLQQQLQPHFLFNTHHSILTLMKLGEKEKAAAMLEKLSELMRIALRESEDQKVTLEKEIETLRLYLDIQKIRFEDKLEVVYDVQDTYKKILVPGMILQPLAENAVKYATEISTGKSMIMVKAMYDDDKLTLSVKDQSDDGKMPGSIEKGIGLSNTEERLHKLYGDDYLLSLSPYQHNGHGGLEVNITIPAQYE